MKQPSAGTATVDGAQPAFPVGSPAQRLRGATHETDAQPGAVCTFVFEIK